MPYVCGVDLSGTSVLVGSTGEGTLVAQVVLVEDDAGLQALFGHVLTRAGHTVMPCRDADRALDHIRDALPDVLPDLVITDVDLPSGMTGLELVQALKADPATATVPVMMITGSETLVHEHDRTDLACYLVKPVLAGDLASHVDHVLADGLCV